MSQPSFFFGSRYRRGSAKVGVKTQMSGLMKLVVVGGSLEFLTGVFLEKIVMFQLKRKGDWVRIQQKVKTYFNIYIYIHIHIYIFTYVCTVYKWDLDFISYFEPKMNELLPWLLVLFGRGIVQYWSSPSIWQIWNVPSNASWSQRCSHIFLIISFAHLVWHHIIHVHIPAWGAGLPLDSFSFYMFYRYLAFLNNIAFQNVC